MKCNIETHTNGKGPHTEEARLVVINRLGIGYSSLTYYPDEPFSGELRAYFEPSGFTRGSWNVEGYGLIFKDKLWMREFKKGLRELGLSTRAVQNVTYSVKEMQGNDYVSMDVEAVFYTSWLKLLAKQAKVIQEETVE